MDNCFIKASKSYKNITNLPKKFCEFPLWGKIQQHFATSFCAKKLQTQTVR